MRKFLSVIFLGGLFASLSLAQISPATTWAAGIRNGYRVTPNVTYVTANNYESKLDVYSRSDSETPQPTLIYIHGGGWVGGTKEGAVMAILPWLAMGWNVVNVEYRLGRVSLAPAAVEDCLCALKWVGANAAKYHFDTSRLVTSGDSAGGHLSLTTAMVPAEAGLDRECPGSLPKVAAIVDWYGISDVNDLLDGPNLKNYAVAWLGSLPNRDEVARRVSPLTYVRAGLPPTLMIQGDADPTVPYSHSLRLQAALQKVGVPNQLFTVPGGKHGGFTPEQQIQIFTTIQQFLRDHKLSQQGPS